VAKGDTVITVPTAQIRVTAHAPTLWVSANFSEPWFRDAAREAEGKDRHHSTRREIVFAASFLESYIFEWARQVCGLERINEYFPPKARFKGDHRIQRPLKDKWKCVPGELHTDGLISKIPDLDHSGLGMLVEFRNGLLHARASRPSTESLSKEFRPVPEPGQLESIGHGWACGVAKKLVLKLHEDLQTPAPSYLEAHKDA
jgi:hypothetical protein